MQRFTLDQLSTLRALVEDGTFEKAARRLHITASAVSQRVKAMEQSAGRVLVQRTTPVALTGAGSVVLRYARQVELLEADTLRSLQEGGATGAAVPISLAVNADSLATWFLGALAGVAEDLDLAVDLHREDQEHTVSLLRSGAVMAAVTSSREPIQGCVTEPLGRMRYRAVATPAFVRRRLAGGLAALAEAPVVTFDRNDDLQDAFLRSQGARPGAAARHVIPASNDFARAVLMGLGWGVLPEQQCLAELNDGTLVQLAAEHPVDVPLYWQRWNLSSPLLDAVSAAVRECAARELLPLTA
ncbi:LysR family transcriptional regulator ArgP [Cryobacterium sp.]|jgi:LysR family transcriptional regulator (chromosome initiation inhibitor)|uniref:LysR family transcriptional regulator ArgP n=1 Tax=Cryobacterium sp. TaxID=1926290 RepID=UPI0026128A58|nr:LysR family transcriptional regulator ArgP [Cryobacterium sp.]MCU1446511.1 Chromosome replication initiation inhibitor protein [Cryobacterium sp.]